MAERDPNLPQSADPELQADLVRLLQIQGPLGLLNVLDVVIPTVSMGQVVPLDVEVRTPVFRSTDIFSNGILLAPVANTVLADTGALADGNYDVQLAMQSNSALTNDESFRVEHRNAANAANLAVWDYLVLNGASAAYFYAGLTFAYQLASNERLRIINPKATTAGRSQVATIFARRRA